MKNLDPKIDALKTSRILSPVMLICFLSLMDQKKQNLRVFTHQI